MLSGTSPFQDENSKATYDRIVTGRIRWPSSRTKYFSQAADELISSLLVFDPKQRLGSNSDLDIKKHSWFHPLDWEGLEQGAIKPPYYMLRPFRSKDQTIAHSESFRGSGDITHRIGNRDLDLKYSTDFVQTGPEIQLSTGGDSSDTNGEMAIGSKDQLLFDDF